MFSVAIGERDHVAELHRAWVAEETDREAVVHACLEAYFECGTNESHWANSVLTTLCWNSYEFFCLITELMLSLKGVTVGITLQRFGRPLTTSTASRTALAPLLN